MHFEEFGRSFSHRIFTTRFTFVFFLLNTPAEVFPGQSEVIGSPQPIVAVVGDDVILPCRLEPQLNVEDLTVEWTRRDLRAEYVHLHRDGREMLAMKNPLYSGRTVLSRDGLKHGDISLKITNVTLADGGKYRCFLPKLHSRKKQSVVQLVVLEQLPQDSTNSGTTEKPQQPEDPHQKEETDTEGQPSKWLIPTVVVLLVILLALICGAYLLIRFFKRKQQGDALLGLEAATLQPQEKHWISRNWTELQSDGNGLPATKPSKTPNFPKLVKTLPKLPQTQTFI